MESRQLTSVADVIAFVLAGNAIFTLRSRKTGDRFTFKVRKPDDDKPHFVSLMTGSDNESSYTFFGTIFSDGRYTSSSRSNLVNRGKPGVHPGVFAFEWFWSKMKQRVMPDQLEVWHEGRCGRCGRLLTVPESIDRGLGPECATKFTINTPAHGAHLHG